MKAVCKWVQQYGPLLGRLLLANLFIVSGFKKIAGFAGTAGYMAKVMPALDPNLVNIMLALTIAIELGGGLMILVGWQARWAAAAILLWMIPVTYLFHAYWGLPPDQMQAQFIQFQKNMAIMGALLFVVAQGPGPCSLGKDNC
ncbi:DoxX family protein [Sulfuricaulis limicola]|uniref:DoxX family protein n=1 Tax=Sulfuricaulis limicola TaxID=1620215 RepID=A0A1B4XC60_9GAMM|nr:DoxX family protein [Sulfuricaulis limicola]BAV32407.1 DoxX family protein [Sulfuricaulis limicola]